VVALVAFVAWSYWLYAGRPATTRGTIAFVLSVVAALAAYDGITLAVREYAREHNGVVTAGTVTGKLSSTGAGRSTRIRAGRSRRYGRSLVTTNGFAIHDELA